MALELQTEIEFCKEQIKRYSDMYESLLEKYTLLACNTTKSKAPRVRHSKSQTKTAKQKSGSGSAPSSESSSEVSSESGSESEEDHLFDQLVNFIEKSDNKLNTEVKQAKRAFTKSEECPRTDYQLEDLEDRPNQSGRQDHNNCVKDKITISIADDEGFKKIDKRKYDARAGLKEHDEKLAKIYAEEKRLLDMGMDSETVRKKVREQFYPEAIPANERKTPSIYVKQYNKDGKLENKKISILAFDEETYLADDNPEETKKIVDRQENMSKMDLPTIEDQDDKQNNEQNNEKLNKLLLSDDDDDEEDILEEKPVD